MTGLVGVPQHIPAPAAATGLEPEPKLRQLLLEDGLLDRDEVAAGLGPHGLLPPLPQLVQLAGNAVGQAGLEGLGGAAAVS
jgi:hypothetical protein